MGPPAPASGSGFADGSRTTTPRCGAKLVARLTNPSLWMWIAYAMVGLAVTIFLLSRSIGRVPGAPG